MERIKETPFDRLEKDWLNLDWKPFYFADIANFMENIRCRFAASLNLASQLDMCLPSGILSLLHEEDEPVLKETIRDFGLNQLTRLDLFARGLYQPAAEQVTEALVNMPFCLTGPLASMTAVVLPSPLGSMIFDDEIYIVFLQALADENYRPKTLAELHNHPLLKMYDSSLFLAIINILVAAGLVFPAKASSTPQSEIACARLNRILCEKVAMEICNLPWHHLFWEVVSLFPG